MSVIVLISIVFLIGCIILGWAIKCQYVYNKNSYLINYSNGNKNFDKKTWDVVKLTFV